MLSVRDQIGNLITLPVAPNRIVSLVPSQTELLFDLGLEQNVVGITKFCVHPQEALKNKTIIGGTKKFDFHLIDQLRPDLIIGNKEENYKEGIELLQRKCPVWMSDIFTLADATDMMQRIGEVCDRKAEAMTIVNHINSGFSNITLKSPARVLYLIWRKPWMAAGPNTFIDSMLKTIGWTNAVDTPRYPELTDADIRQMNPDIVLLSSEPYPFKEKHSDELRSLVPHAKIILVDGEMFSWYGSRLLKAPDYFNNLVV